MNPLQPITVNLIFSPSSLSVLFAEYLVCQEAKQGVIFCHSDHFFVPTCSVDHPFEYIRQMYKGPTSSENRVVEKRRGLKQGIRKGYSAVHFIGKHLIISYKLDRKSVV